MKPNRWRCAVTHLVLTMTLALGMPAAASGQSTIVQDHFLGTTLANHAPDTNLPNHVWSVTGSGATLSGQRAWAAGADWAGILATIDAGVSDGTIAVDWTPGGETPYGAIVARATDAANYIVAYYWSGTLYLYRIASAGNVLLASTPIDDPGAMTHRLKMTLAGSSIRVFVDGVQRLSATDAFNVAVTKHGFRWLSYYDWMSAYANFRIDGVFVPMAATTSVAPTPTQVTFLASTTLTATARDAASQSIPDTSFSWASSNPNAIAIVPASGNTATAIAVGAGAATITATPANGASGAANVTVNTGAVAIHDSFSGSDATLLTAHAPEVDTRGASWSTTGSGAALNANRVVPRGADWNPITATIESGISDGVIGVDWLPGPSYQAAALIARATDDDNYFLALYWSRVVALFRVTSAGAAMLGQASVEDPTGGTHRLEMKLAGSAVQVWWDGVQQIVAIDTFNNAATRHGFRWYSYWDWQSAYDRFDVSALPAIANVTVTPTVATIPMNGGRVLTAQALDGFGVPIPGISFDWLSSNAAVASTRVASPTAWCRHRGGRGHGYHHRCSIRRQCAGIRRHHRHAACRAGRDAKLVLRRPLSDWSDMDRGRRHRAGYRLGSERMPVGSQRRRSVADSTSDGRDRASDGQLRNRREYVGSVSDGHAQLLRCKLHRDPDRSVRAGESWRRERGRRWVWNRVMRHVGVAVLRPVRIRRVG